MNNLQATIRETRKINFLTKDEQELLERTQKNESFFLFLKLQEQLRNTLLEYLNTPQTMSGRLSSNFHNTIEILKFYHYPNQEKRETDKGPTRVFRKSLFFL